MKSWADVVLQKFKSGYCMQKTRAQDIEENSPKGRMPGCVGKEDWRKPQIDLLFTNYHKAMVKNRNWKK